MLVTIDFETLFQRSPNPYIVLDAALTIVWMNDAYLRTTMRSRDALIGLSMFDAFPSDPASEEHGLLRSSLERVRATSEADEIALIRYAIAKPDGTMEDRFWSATHTPLLDSNGNVGFILQHTVDVSELESLRRARDESGVIRRAQAVQARNADLHAETGRLRALFEQAPGFMAVLQGPEHRFQLANAAYRRLVGGREVIGKTVGEALPEIVDQGFVTILDQVHRSGEPYIGRGEKIVLKADGSQASERFLDFVYQPIVTADDEISGVFVQGHEVTEEIMLLQRQNLLINELNHRVKNTLAIVQGLAAQSFRAVDPAGDVRQVFHGRLQALAAAHDLLTARTWQSITLGEMIQMATEVTLGEDTARLDVAGPEVPLLPQHAVALAMIVHELCTNALKHGALSVPAGQVAVRWELAAGADADSVPVTVTWTERGGPTVAPPARKGFGLRLIERGLSAELEGKARLDFLPNGLECRLDLVLPRDLD